MRAFIVVVLALQSIAGCNAVGKVALKATPSMRDPSRFEYSVEFQRERGDYVVD